MDYVNRKWRKKINSIAESGKSTKNAILSTFKER